MTGVQWQNAFYQCLREAAGVGYCAVKRGEAVWRRDRDWSLDLIVSANIWSNQSEIGAGDPLG